VDERSGWSPTALGSPVELAGALKLVDWQEQAVESWWKGDQKGPQRGTLEIFTGGGKTLIALAAFARVSAVDPQTRLAVVVPTEALARQWVTSLTRHTSLTRPDIGMLGAGRRDDLEGKRALVAVLNSAARRLPELASTAQPLMLVVDECHRAGAPTFSRVLTTPARYRMGLSATPARDEVDEAGLPLEFDRQVVGQRLGQVVFQFGLREAREVGWLPEYTVHHHGVHLTEQEAREYEQLGRKVNDAADRLTASGIQTSQAWHLATRGGELAALAQSYIGALAVRKDFLYRASERGRVAARIVEQAFRRQPQPRMLLFHERVSEATSLFRELRERLPEAPIALEHSELPAPARRNALTRFRSGDAKVLVSVKTLVEGIDVPDADVGISVASSSSVRQRIQTLGRVLRRRFDGGIKQAEMHVIYVQDTVDEAIYGKEDWSDLTGSEANQYWVWPIQPELPPEIQPGPPLEPRPTEEAEWIRFGQRVPDSPVPWLGAVPDYEFSVDTRGNVTTSDGAWIDNPQGVAGMVERVRGRPGGRFRVTPVYNLVIVYVEGERVVSPYVAGQLLEPFRVRDGTATTDAIDASELKPGDPYPGPTDTRGGTYKLRQKRGGVIERRQGRVTEFALTDSPEADSRTGNARHLLTAWRSLKTPGLTFYLNGLEHAWYREGGEARFLAAVPGGFLWPRTESSGGSTLDDQS
jgi:superfamily II DNA or RNA helicase